MKLNRAIFKAFVPIFFFFFILRFCKIFFNLPFTILIRDNPFFQFGSPLEGILSNIGIFLWFVSFAINFILLVKLKNYIFIKPKLRLITSLTLGGIFSILLFFSDLFDLQNRYEEVVYLILIISSISLFFFISKIHFYKNIKSIFFLSCVFLALSMTTDFIQHRFNFDNIGDHGIDHYVSLLEELFKFIGIFYFTFFWMETFKKFNKQINLFN